MTDSSAPDARLSAQPFRSCPTAQIDASNIPELLDRTGASRGLFFNLAKLQLPLR